MTKGKTETGFEFELSDEAVDNYELLEILTDIDKGQGKKIVDAIDMLLGEEQRNRLKEHVREKNGRVSTKAMWKEFVSILGEANGKKS